MNKKYELVVKGINNYPDKITVTVALEIGGYPSLLLPHVAISLDRTEGATLEFYEAEAKKQAKRKRLVRTVLIFTESSDQLSRATDRVP
ncbi:DUF1327 domain-containing protein, partial [Escherichia coli]|nr:DUF1327 domain-containing protein [Escherichia coli]